MSPPAFWNRLARGRSAPGRETGPPTSSNGASSFHLFWDVPDLAYRRVTATLEVIAPPTVDRLYFWALQVDFTDGRSRAGGAHLGLQHHPDHPEAGAVNWGGYALDGSILTGSESALPSALNNANTRDFPWRSSCAYRLCVEPADDERSGGRDRRWRGSITDLTTDRTTIVRDLHSTGSALARPMVWSEVFARCEDPTVTVRWCDLEAEDSDGVIHRPRTVRTNYQTVGDGGCSNSDIHLDERGICQSTNRPRRTPQGSTVPCRP